MHTVNQKLAQLILNRPDLPIIFLVQSGVVEEGALSDAKAKRYITNRVGDLIFDDDDVALTVKKMLGQKAFSELRDDQVKEEYAKLPWREAIFILIEQPE